MKETDKAEKIKSKYKMVKINPIVLLITVNITGLNYSLISYKLSNKNFKNLGFKKIHMFTTYMLFYVLVSHCGFYFFIF